MKKIISVVCSFLLVFTCSGCGNSKQFEADYTELFNEVDEVTKLADTMSPTILTLWDQVGPEYLTGVLSLIVTAENAEDLENPVFSNTKYPQFRFSENVTFNGDNHIDNYYDLLAVAMGYGNSYRTFGAGTAIPHDQTIKMFETFEPYRTAYAALSAKTAELESKMKEFRSQYREKYSEEVGYLYDYCSEALSYANAVLSPSGSYNTFTSDISNYQSELEKLRRDADLY